MMLPLLIDAMRLQSLCPARPLFLTSLLPRYIERLLHTLTA